MLDWIVTFFVLAILAALLGYGGLAGGYSGIAQVCSVVFLILFIVSLIYSMIGRTRTPLL